MCITRAVEVAIQVLSADAYIFPFAGMRHLPVCDFTPVRLYYIWRIAPCPYQSPYCFGVLCICYVARLLIHNYSVSQALFSCGCL